MIRLLSLVVLFAGLWPASAGAVLPHEVLADPALETRARALSKEIRCQVCQNQDIDDSNAPLAADLRRLVRERLQAGDSDPQILSFLVQRYGDYVLMRPPVRPSTWPLWFGPGLLFISAAVALFFVARRRRHAPEAVKPLAPDEERRLNDIMGRKG
jgi:cytochrome c-type biogenesis protein CcmH